MRCAGLTLLALPLLAAATPQWGRGWMAAWGSSADSLDAPSHPENSERGLDVDAVKRWFGWGAVYGGNTESVEQVGEKAKRWMGWGAPYSGNTETFEDEQD